MERNCKQKWAESKISRVRDIRAIWNYERKHGDEHPERGSLNNYGLSLDWIEPTEKRPGYFCWLISWGGPSSEFRFYTSGPDYMPHRVTYAYLDWGDGYERDLTGRDLELMREIYQDWLDCETPQHLYKNAVEER